MFLAPPPLGRSSAISSRMRACRYAVVSRRPSIIIQSFFAGRDRWVGLVVVVVISRVEEEDGELGGESRCQLSNH